MRAVPVVDVSGWAEDRGVTRDVVAAGVDEAMHSSGFLVLEGHGVADEVVARAREAAGRFLGLPEDVKDPYRTTVGGRGWVPFGVEANGYSAGVATPPDLKESFVCGREEPADGNGVRAAPLTNVWPTEVPELRESMVAFMDEAARVAMLVLEVCGRALDVGDDALTRLCRCAPYGCNVNRYPSMAETGRPREGQFRIGPHTDFGTVTVLDRQPGVGALQIQTTDGDWIDAPFLPGTLTINAGDLLALWTGGRWRSTPHRVLPPDRAHPDEELTSLVFFHTADADAVIRPFGPDGAGMAPVVAGEHLRRQLDAIRLAPT